MKRPILGGCVAVMALITAQAFSQQTDDVSYREGYSLILEQNWKGAQQFFTDFQSEYPDSGWRDDAAFWNCYALEQASPIDISQFNCYQSFVNDFNRSSWVSDAISKQIVLATQLASRGYPNLVTQVSTPPNDFDFEFDFDDDLDFDFDYDVDIDEDELSRNIERSLARAERELSRMQRNLQDRELPEPPVLTELPDFEDFNVLVDVDDVRRTIRDIQIVRNDRVVRSRGSSRGRSSADDELLAILSALRNNERASDILLQRLDDAGNPELRARIVLLLEDIRGDAVTDKLVELVDDEAEQVRNNAVLVLVDRNVPRTRDRLLEIARDDNYPVYVRAGIVSEMDRWDPDTTVENLAIIIRSSSDQSLVAEAADALADIGSEAAIAALMEYYDTLNNMELRHIVLEEIGNVRTQEVLNFLSGIAVNDSDDDSAAIAIEGIADSENNFAVAALEHIYLSTDSMQRRLAAIEGIGDAEIPRSVEVLEQFLDGETDATLVASIVRALSNTEQESAVAVVLNAYESHDEPTVRRAAIRALRGLDDYLSATDALLRILEDRLNEETAQ